MDFVKGVEYIAYQRDNPLKNFKFEVIRADDFFLDAKIKEGFQHLKLWKPYTVKVIDEKGEQSFYEIAPYQIEEKEKCAKFLILGKLLERRKFVRFNVESIGIRIESENFEGIVENISLGGLKIKILNKKGEIEVGKPIFVKAYLGDQSYGFVITPVRAGEDFIGAKFEKPPKVTSEFFYRVLKLLEEETKPVNERRKFRRFYVEPFNIIVDSPLGVGVMHDISLGGMKVKLKRTYDVDESILKDTFAVSCFIPSKNEEYVIDCQLVERGKDNFVQFKIARWDEQALKLISRILELIVENKKV
jgi:hypothetical protein